jgi:flagellar basal-body rod protein FlgB
MNAMLQKMDWIEARQKVLAQNIANADTPGYQPQDIAKPDFKMMLDSSASKLPMRSVGMAVTDPKHITSGGASAGGSNVKPKNEKKPYETSPSGNAVVLEEQLLKMNENKTDHEFITNLYEKQVQMIKQSEKSQ